MFTHTFTTCQEQGYYGAGDVKLTSSKHIFLRGGDFSHRRGCSSQALQRSAPHNSRHFKQVTADTLVLWLATLCSMHSCERTLSGLKPCFSLWTWTQLYTLCVSHNKLTGVNEWVKLSYMKASYPIIAVTQVMTTSWRLSLLLYLCVYKKRTGFRRCFRG